MAKLIAARTAQPVMEAEFTFNFDDTMVSSTGVELDFGKVNVAATSVDIINLPTNAVVLGGEVVTDTALDAATYNITIGDADVANRYLGTTDRKATGRTALVPTGYRTTGKPVRLTFTAADVCTAGKMTVRVQYITEGRGIDVNP
jgi:hypothetical protein